MRPAFASEGRRDLHAMLSVESDDDGYRRKNDRQGPVRGGGRRRGRLRRLSRSGHRRRSAVAQALDARTERGRLRVWEAVDGKTGLQIVADGPNLVLLDLRLPDMDGLQVLRAVRRMRDKLPIVVLSRIGDEDAKVAALDAGADDYVMKPFGIKELLARIRVALRHRGLSPTDNRLLSVGDLVLDVEERTVKVRKKELKLSGKE